MKLRYGVAVLALCLGLGGLASAATLKGTAINGTTGKPAAGAEVILLSVAGGGREVGRGWTDAGGGFQFTVAGKPEEHLVRVVHQGVAYQNLAPAGFNPVEVEVYDIAAKLDGVTATWGMQRLQTEGDRLQVIEEITVSNASDPPRTLVNSRPFEIQLRPDAEVVAGTVKLGDGRPIVGRPNAVGEKGRYYFPFPLLPGDTRFAVAYRLPYRGEAVIAPMTLYSLTELVVVLPETMQFEPKSPDAFRPMADRPGAKVWGTAPGNQGQPLAFHVSGMGRLPESPRGQQSAHRKETSRTGPAPAPPPHRYRWYIFSGLALILVSGVAGLLAHKRNRRGAFRLERRAFPDQGLPRVNVE